MRHGSRTIRQERVRYFSVEEGFNIKRPDLGPCIFVEEAEQAFGPGTRTGFVVLDRSD